MIGKATNPYRGAGAAGTLSPMKSEGAMIGLRRVLTTAAATLSVTGMIGLAGASMSRALAQSSDMSRSPNEGDIEKSLEVKKPKPEPKSRFRGFGDPKALGEQRLMGQLWQRSISIVSKVSEEQRAQITTFIND